MLEFGRSLWIVVGDQPAVTVDFASALEDPPAPPAAGYFVVVARGERGLYRHLRIALANDAKTTVLLDRRRADAGPPRGVAERRRPVPFRQDPRLHFAVVIRDDAPPPPGGEDNVNNGEVVVVNDRERVERWVEDSQYVIGRLIPGLLEDRDRWRAKAEAAEQEIDSVRLEMAAMRKEIAERESERQYLRGEQAAVAEAFNRAMEHLTQMQQPLKDVLHRLHAMEPVLVEVNGR